MYYLLNFLTYSRILLTPVLVWLILTEDYSLAAFVFIYCSLSDLFDGKIARKYDLVSEKGNYLDPLADKILMIGTLTSLLMQGLVAFWAYFVIIGRDILITFYRNYMIAKNTPLVTSKLGKWKTASQHVAVIFCLLCFPEAFQGQQFYPFFEFSNGLEIYYLETLNLIFGLNAVYSAFTGIHYVWKNGF
jgi:CDP-diacylglycerol--glycerol-3-phosphate 3-phosphatidyltransferase